MKKLPIKLKILVFLSMVIFMVLYMFIFGSKNAAIGMIIAMALIMNLQNDLSYKPLISFIKVLGLFLILGIVSFFNNPLTIGACILTFIVVFGTTFTSYRLFGTDTYLPLLMLYFMMVGIPITYDQLPMRLLSLVFGAICVVGFNILVNKKKDYKLSKKTLTDLTIELEHAVDLKINGEKVIKENFKTANGFYQSIYDKFEYKFFPSAYHESVLNIVKSFQYIGVILSDFDLKKHELEYIKKILFEIKEGNVLDIFNGITIETPQMNLILLNLEIISSEMVNKNLENGSIIPKGWFFKKSFKTILKKSFSFKSAKFTFAFKMAVVLTLWQVLSLLFNLPYSKWLYFISIPLMLPYINDFAYTAKSRIIGTIIGVFIFLIIYLSIPFIPIQTNVVILVVMGICMYGMAMKLEDKLVLTIFTTIMSVMAALMYIPITLAAPLKIVWVVVGAIVVMLINFGFLPYSVEKKTEDNLKAKYELNQKSFELIKQKCEGNSSSQKTTLIVIDNIITDNIEVTEENKELYYLQIKITDICNFILNYLYVNEPSEGLKENLKTIIDGNNQIDENLNIKDRVISYSMVHAMNLFKKQEELIL